MKFCPQCGLDKSELEFYRNKAQKSGLSAQCKLCCKKNAATFRADNPDVAKARVRSSWSRNSKRYRDARKGAMATYRAKNVEKIADYFAGYRRANRARLTAYRADVRAAKKQATPVWANKTYMRMFYEQAKAEAARVGKAVEVDHIVPLQNELVCGLHCEHNLQLLLRKDNRVKGNRLWPHMP